MIWDPVSKGGDDLAGFAVAWVGWRRGNVEARSWLDRPPAPPAPRPALTHDLRGNTVALSDALSPHPVSNATRDVQTTKAFHAAPKDVARQGDGRTTRDLIGNRLKGGHEATGPTNNRRA